MKILVTGAAGFIGFHLCKRLLIAGYEVIGIDNINDYYDVDLKYDRLKECGINRELIADNHLVKSSIFDNFSFQKLDIDDGEPLMALFAKNKFSKVLHMAAQAGVRYSLINPHAYIQSNIVGFANILEACRHNSVDHLVYASSSSVYGMNEAIPFSEDDRVDYPVSLYAATKKSNELMAHAYSHLYKLPTTGLRFFTVYGPWGRPDMSPILFADAIVQEKPIKVFNGGDMLRDFTYVDDIVSGVVKIADKSPNSGLSTPYFQLLNIGNSKPIQLMDFIRTMEDTLGKEGVLKMYPMQPGDVKVTYADTTKLEAIIDYKPDTDLEIGVRSFVEWYKDYYKPSV